MNLLQPVLDRPKPFIGGISCLLVLCALIAANTLWLGPVGRYDAHATLQAWGATMVLIVLFILLIGYGINSRPAGMFIDNRNRVSLSKFQATCWTVIVLSAYGTMAAARSRAGIVDPLALDIPPELLVAMGISTASLVATPVLLSLKTTNAASPDQIARAATGTGTSIQEATAAGQVFGRTTPAAAQWLDMFRGEDVSNADAPDLSKIQQFLLTLLILGVYCAAIAGLISEAAAHIVKSPDGKTAVRFSGLLLSGKASLPQLSPNFIWLMGISHVSYLAYKAVPHGPDTSAQNAQDAVG